MTTLKPGQRVVLREGKPYRLMGGAWAVFGNAGKGGKSATVKRLHPFALYENVEAIDAHGETIWFTLADAELAGPLP